VKVAGCYDPSFTGPLTYVKTIEMCVESVFTIIYVPFTIVDCFLCFGEDG
jgi:hypothetical protein